MVKNDILCTKINFKNFKVIRTTRLLFIFKQIDLFLKEEPIHVHLYNNLYRLFSSEDLFNRKYSKYFDRFNSPK